MNVDWRSKSEETPCKERTSSADHHCPQRFSGSAPVVAMIETAHLWDSHDASEFGRLHRPRFR